MTPERPLCGELLISGILLPLRGVHLGLNPLPRLRSHFQGACVRRKKGQLGPIARQSENENAPCSGLFGLMRGESQGMQCYAHADVRRSGKPGVPVGLHEETIRITSVFCDNVLLSHHTTPHPDCMVVWVIDSQSCQGYTVSVRRYNYE